MEYLQRGYNLNIFFKVLLFTITFFIAYKFIYIKNFYLKLTICILLIITSFFSSLMIKTQLINDIIFSIIFGTATGIAYKKKNEL